MPFRTSVIECDEKALFWSEKGTSVILKMRNEYNLKGFVGFKDGNGYRISDMASSIEEAKNDFIINRENLIKVFGVIIPPSQNDPKDPDYLKKEKEHRENYWKNLVEKIEKS